MSDFNNDRDIEKKPDKGIISKSTGMKKAENFWYYNKWKIIILIFVVIVVLICVLQMCQSNKIDTYILYAGSHPMLDSGEYNGMKAAFEAILPYDLNKDGEDQVQIIHHYVLSEENIESLNAVTDEEGSKVYYPDINFNISELKQFDSLIMAGEYSICIISPFLYDRVKTAGGFVKLSDLFSETPFGAIDEFGIRFADTEFAKYYEVFSVLPSDSILCLRTPSTLLGGNNKNSAEYKLSVDMFKSIVNFISQDQN